MPVEDPAVTERQMYVNLALGGVDDPSLTLAELRDRTGGGVDAGKAVKASYLHGNGIIIKPEDINLPVTGLVDGGLVDASAVIQKTIDKGAALAKRRDIYLPAGTYLLNTPLDISYPCRIIGAGNRNTILKIANEATSAFKAMTDDVIIEGLQLQADTDKWAMFVWPTAQTTLKNWRFDKCYFNRVGLNISVTGRNLGNGANEVTATRLGLNIKVKDCEFANYTGNETIFIAGAVGTKIEGCYIHDNGTDTNSGEGIKILHAASGTVIDGNLFERSKRDGIDAYNSIATTIVNNVILTPGVCGIEIKWTDTDTYDTKDTLIANNRVEDAGSTSYNCDSFRTTVIGNTALRGGASGFRLSANSDGGTIGTDGGLFVGNSAIQCAGDGFVGGPLATNLTFVGNMALNNTGFGFSVVGAHNIVGNVSAGNTAGNWNPSGLAALKSFLANTGGNENGEYRIGNNVGIKGYKTDNTLHDIVRISAANVMIFGSPVGANAPNIRFLTAGAAGLIEFSGRAAPAANNTMDLGVNLQRWKDVYVAGIIKTTGFTTAGRPTAASAGVGGYTYDTTLSKPIWSDGTVWRDAAGTAV